jgi:hypothetical protein
VRAGGPIAPETPLELAPGGGTSPLEQQLAASLEAEQAMKQAGTSAAERAAIRAGLRSALGGSMQALPFLLGAQPLEQQMQEAAPLLERLRSGPSIGGMIDVRTEAAKAGMTPEQYIAWVRSGRQL